MTAIKSFATGATAIAVAFIPLYLAVALAGPVPMAAGAQDEHGRWWSDGCLIGIETSGSDLEYGIAIGDGWAEGTLPKPGSLTWEMEDGETWAIYLAKPGHNLKLRDSGVGDCGDESTTTTSTTTSLPPPDADIQVTVDCDWLTVTNQGDTPVRLTIGVSIEGVIDLDLPAGATRRFERQEGPEWGVMDADTNEILASGYWPEECDTTTTTTTPPDGEEPPTTTTPPDPDTPTPTTTTPPGEDGPAGDAPTTTTPTCEPGLEPDGAGGCWAVSEGG